MKRIIASVGVLAVGVSGACAANVMSAMDASKPWNVSASLRGFYDDNYTYAAEDELDSFGFEISPSVGVSLPLEQTFLSARYTYRGRYYEDRDNNDKDPVTGNDNDPWDHTHQFDALLNHAFSERYSLNLSDSFVISQEPEILAPQNGVVMPYRADGNNIRNQGYLRFDAQMTRLLGLRVGYNNVFWDYDDEDYDAATGASRSGLLDRMEQLGLLEARWRVMPETTALLGYTFQTVHYTSDEFVGVWGGVGAASKPVYSDDRDVNRHTLYAGGEHSFSPNLNGVANIGATFSDPTEEWVGGDGDWSPFADISVSYTYAKGSYARLGFLHAYNQTDVVARNADDGTVTSSQITSSIYGILNHRITPKLSGSLGLRFQDSVFDGGGYENDSEQFFMAGVNLSYMFNNHFSADLGYNFDTFDSDINGREYDRNRVYLGVTASY